MNIFLDDDLRERITPKTFERFTTGYDLKAYLKSHDKTQLDVEYISFDNDLGLVIEGYDVLKYMVNQGISAKVWNLHSANVVAVKNMESYLRSAMKSGIIETTKITRKNAMTVYSEYK